MFNEFRNISKTFLLALAACTILFCAEANGQRARFDDFFASQPSSIPTPANTFPGIPGNLSNQSSIITTPQNQLTPPLASLQQPNFSPGSFQNPILVPPNLNQPNQTFPIFPRGGQSQFTPPQLPQFNQPQFNQPQFNQQQLPQYNAPQYNMPQFGSPQGPSWYEDAWGSFTDDFLPRVLEQPRARYTYIQGTSDNQLNINDLELATTATWPNFLQGATPLRMSPEFTFHFWDGPDSTVNPFFDLPAQAYSAALAFDHLTDPSKIAGLENNFTVGYYSDFDNTSTDAIRMTGSVVGWYRISPHVVGKFGAEYIDRVKVKLLPAFGVYMTPTPDIKFDLFFPKTKLAHRLPNVNNLEVWGYFGAEYGGGSWAIRRRDGSKDEADINDVRTYIGIEWMGPRRVLGSLEAGYVFDREILYRSDESMPLDLKDSFMVRGGLAF